MNNEQRIAVVTGGYKGIGLAVSQSLAKQGMLVVIAGRDPNEGNAVVTDLKKQGWSAAYAPLEVTRFDDIERLRNFLDHTYGRLDVLINNAGIFPDRPEVGILNAKIDTLRSAMETNVYGPVALCQMLIPLMNVHHYGRIVNVSSGMGQLSEMEGGYPAYRLSKTSLNAVTRILAAEVQDSGILVNSACPGWVKTDMGGPDAPRSPEEGADTIVWLATLPEDGPTGRFFRDRKPIDW